MSEIDGMQYSKKGFLKNQAIQKNSQEVFYCIPWVYAGQRFDFIIEHNYVGCLY